VIELVADEESSVVAALVPGPTFPDLGLKILGHCVLCGGPCYGAGSEIHTEACAQFREQLEALRALQIEEHTLWDCAVFLHCSLCAGSWIKGEPECHREGCVAAPLKKKEV
jgi:hypothetical protein